MKATKILPGNYLLHGTLDLSKNTPVIVVLNLGALGLFFLFGYLFLRLAVALRPDPAAFSIGSLGLPMILAILLSYVAVLVLHELIHGLFFWLITRERPRFGFKAVYAYASAPDWYLPRNPYLVVGLAPLVLITLMGSILIPIVPPATLILLLFAMTVNASGAIGDMITVGWVLTQPATSLVQDTGDAFTIYRAASA